MIEQRVTEDDPQFSEFEGRFNGHHAVMSMDDVHLLQLAQALNTIRSRLDRLETRAPTNKQLSPIDDAPYQLLDMARVSGVYEPEAVLIDSMRAKGRLCYTWGDTQSGKTSIEVEIVMRMACEMDFFGFALDPGYSVIVAGEGKEDIDKQIDAFMLEYPGATIKYPPKIIDMRVYVDSPDAITALTAQLLKEYQGKDKPLNTIVFDTLSVCLLQADENSNMSMAQVCNTLIDMARELGASVVVIHHTGKKGGTMRGASAMVDNAYCVWAVKSDGTHFDLTVKKSKGMDKYKGVMRFTYKIHNLGRMTTQGKPVTGITLHRDTTVTQPMINLQQNLLHMIGTHPDESRTELRKRIKGFGIKVKEYVPALNKAVVDGVVLELPDDKDKRTKRYRLS